MIWDDHKLIGIGRFQDVNKGAQYFFLVPLWLVFLAGCTLIRKPDVSAPTVYVCGYEPFYCRVDISSYHLIDSTYTWVHHPSFDSLRARIDNTGPVFRAGFCEDVVATFQVDDLGYAQEIRIDRAKLFSDLGIYFTTTSATERWADSLIRPVISGFAQTRFLPDSTNSFDPRGKAFKVNVRIGP